MTTPRVTVPVEPTDRDEELRKAVFGQVDLETAELEINGAVYDGWAAAIMVRGQPRTIAMTREYSDAVQIMALIDRARSLSAVPAPEGGAVKSMGQRAYENMRDNNDNASHAMNSNKSWAELSDEERQGWEEDAKERPHLYALATREEAPADHISDTRQMVEAPAEAGGKGALALALEDLAVASEAVRRLLHNSKAHQSRAFDQAGVSFVSAINRAKLVLKDYDRLRAQSPARIEAQPVGWQWRAVDNDGPRTSWRWLDQRTESEARDWAASCTVERRPLYTHPAPDALRVAVEDIAAERQRQVDAEGWSAERDDEYTDRSLAHAAAAYALGFDLETRPEVITDDVSGGRGDSPVWKNRQIQVPASWPSSWDAEWWKPSDARRDLVKAGALIVAEIERLDRAALQAEQGAK